MKKIFSAAALAALIYAAVTVGYNVNLPEPAMLPAATKQPQPILDIPSLYELTNKERTNLGLTGLVLDPKLNASALNKCSDMVTNNYWAHDSPTGVDPWYFIGTQVDYQAAGENLAYGLKDSRSVVDAWMASPSHKDNIVKPEYTNIGFGICSSPNFVNDGLRTIVVQHFTKM